MAARSLAAVERDQRHGLQAALLAFSLWGLLVVYWKQLAHLDPFEMVGWRVVSAAVLMVVVATLRGRLALIRAAFGVPSTRRRIVLAAALLTVNWGTYVWAVVEGRVVETALGYFLSPLATIALGAVLFGETLGRLQRASVLAASVAVVVLTASYGQVPWVALLLAGSWSWYSLIKRGVPLGPIESLTSELLVVGGPAAVIAATGFFAGSDGAPAQASAGDWVLIAAAGAVTSVPLLLFAFAAPRVPFTLLGPCNYLTPVINFLLGWLVYDEAMPAARFVGFGFVWIALVLVTIHTLQADGAVRRKSEIPAPAS